MPARTTAAAIAGSTSTALNMVLPSLARLSRSVASATTILRRLQRHLQCALALQPSLSVRQQQAVGVVPTRFEPDIDKTLGGFARQRLFPGMVAVATGFTRLSARPALPLARWGTHARSRRFRRLPTCSTVFACSPRTFTLFHVIQTVAVGHRFLRLQLKPVAERVTGPAPRRQKSGYQKRRHFRCGRWAKYSV